MPRLQMKADWSEIKGKLKQKYAQLTDDDLKIAEGKEEELLGRLQQRLGKIEQSCVQVIRNRVMTRLDEFLYVFRKGLYGD